MQAGPYHPAIQPLEWLIGKWKSVQAEGAYPSVKPFTYEEEIEFISLGQPMLNYVSTSWHATNLNPMHLESGYLRIKPGTKDVSFVVAHNFGLTSIEEGSVDGLTLNLKSTGILRMSFAKEPHVTEIVRTYKLNEEGKLELTMNMATNKTPLTKHLQVVYEKFSFLKYN